MFKLCLIIFVLPLHDISVTRMTIIPAPDNHPVSTAKSVASGVSNHVANHHSDYLLVISEDEWDCWRAELLRKMQTALCSACILIGLCRVTLPRMTSRDPLQPWRWDSVHILTPQQLHKLHSLLKRFISSKSAAVYSAMLASSNGLLYLPVHSESSLERVASKCRLRMQCSSIQSSQSSENGAFCAGSPPIHTVA